MPFSFNYLVRNSSSGNVDGGKAWIYNGSASGSNESLATISASGYFNNAQTTLKQIFATGSTGTNGALGVNDVIQINANDATGVYVVTDIINNITLVAQGGGGSGGAVLLTPSGDQTITQDSLTIAAGNFTVSNGNLTVANGNIIGGNNAGAAGNLSLLSADANGFLSLNVAGGSAPGAGMGILLDVMAQGTTVLISDPGVSNAILPLINAASVVAGNLPSFNTTTGVLEDSGIAASNVPASAPVLLAPSADQTITGGNFLRISGSAGSTGFIVETGSYSSFRATASSLSLGSTGNVNGQLRLIPIFGTGVFIITTGNSTLNTSDALHPPLSNPQSTTYTLPTSLSGLATVNLISDGSANQMQAGANITAFKVNGTEAANAVTASGMSGVITTSALTTVAGSSYAITWTNTFITSTSSVLLTVSGGSNTTESFTLKCAPGSGTATLTIYNNDPLAALNGTILITYLVM